ncbi:MAG: uracil-DNA glycosylase [Candidatus Omnitrophica bacterium]|nr:uracil-DNA glycosylase [Candidatus Omnitrophota bacterium]
MNSECKWYQVCPMKRFFEQEKIARHWVDFYCHNNWQKCKRFDLEEKQIEHPDNMLPDGLIDNNLGR